MTVPGDLQPTDESALVLLRGRAERLLGRVAGAGIVPILHLTDVCRIVNESFELGRRSEIARREAVAAFLGLPDVIRIRFEADAMVVVISGDRYDDAQMDRLLNREMCFLEVHPDWSLDIRYEPAALASQEKP